MTETETEKEEETVEDPEDESEKPDGPALNQAPADFEEDVGKEEEKPA